jgi:hypothetical protein
VIGRPARRPHRRATRGGYRSHTDRSRSRPLRRPGQGVGRGWLARTPGPGARVAAPSPRHGPDGPAGSRDGPCDGGIRRAGASRRPRSRRPWPRACGGGPGTSREAGRSPAMGSAGPARPAPSSAWRKRPPAPAHPQRIPLPAQQDRGQLGVAGDPAQHLTADRKVLVELGRGRARGAEQRFQVATRESKTTRRSTP